MLLFYICRVDVGKNKSIAIPVEKTNAEVMKQLKQKIVLGTDHVGNLKLYHRYLKKWLLKIVELSMKK